MSFSNWLFTIKLSCCLALFAFFIWGDNWVKRPDAFEAMKYTGLASLSALCFVKFED